jgi:DNA-binding NarL/FixJ family response regulator
MYKILIADDHPLFRDALQRAVQQALPQAAYGSRWQLAALLALLERHAQADLLLLDLHMPGAHGYSALAHIRGHYPELPVMVVSAHEEALVARRALAHGAVAYVPKSAAGGEIAQAIRVVLEGGLWLPPRRREERAEFKAGEAEVAARIAQLTPQQFRVLGMIAAGLLNKQIAFELGVSEATVKAHMTAIMRKLGVINRTQVALAANQLAIEQGALPAMPDDD